MRSGPKPAKAAWPPILTAAKKTAAPAAKALLSAALIVPQKTGKSNRQSNPLTRNWLQDGQPVPKSAIVGGDFICREPE